MPVEEMEKAAHTRCRHQRHGKGCAVYHTAAMPQSCALWNCRWLVNDDHGDLQRPDRSHFVVDVLPDVIRAIEHETGQAHECDVIVVWCERGHDDAHRDPGLRRYIERAGKPMMVRFHGGEAMVVAPPSLTGGEGWREFPRQLPDPNYKSFANRLRETVQAQRVERLLGRTS